MRNAKKPHRRVRMTVQGQACVWGMRDAERTQPKASPLRGKLSSYNQIRNLVSDLKGPHILEPKPSGSGFGSKKEE